jgi:hypothetical protein
MDLVLAKNIVMAMLYMPEPFLEADLYTWIQTDARPYASH